MEFVDMPKSVEEVMYKLFAPEFDVSLEEIEDTLNILNHIQDDVKKDERGKVLQSLISVISGEAVADDFKQVIMKNHPSVYRKRDLAQSLIYMVKEVTKNKEHPLLCQPSLIPGNMQSSDSLRSENKRIFLPNYWDNSSVNFKDVGDSNMMEQDVQGATKCGKDGQECKNQLLLIPGCAKFPLSRMMHKQEQTGTTNDNGQYQASTRAGCYREKVQIADGWDAPGQFIDTEYSWNFVENSSKMTNHFEETTPMRSTGSIDRYYNMGGGVTPLIISNKERHETPNQQKGVLSRTAKYPKTNEVLLHKVASNCIMVAVKDKTNRFILPKPERRIPMDRNDIKDVSVPFKGISAKSKARKRRGIDVMALCGGHKVGKMSGCNSRSPRDKLSSQLTIRKAFEPKKTGLECFKGVGKSTSVGHLKQGQCPWENVQERFSLLPQNDNQRVEKGLSETVWVESGSKEGCKVISSPFSGGLRSSSLKKTDIEGKAEVDSLMAESNEETLLQQFHVGDLEAVDRVGKCKATAVTGQGSFIEDEEEDPDVLIIDEDPPVQVDSDGNDSKTKNGEKSGGNTDAKIGYWNGQSWIPAGQDQGHYSGQPKGGGFYCEQAVSSMKAGQGKVVKHQGQISRSYLESETSPWCGPNMIHVRTTSSSSEVDFKKTDSQSNASDASSPDASSSADSLSLSQGSDGGSFTSPELPEYSFLFNLLKYHDEMETKDDLCKFSWKKILPKKKGKPRRSRRKRRARETYQN
ncbi:hypothetical protein HOLleu_29248 [Holothuria leucospilota]|uniref:Uncharacterized protein n=1 Tax=Holothuria leucospilota TaxID=206669 RepID=A0A9Q1BNA4_HOLLE|nr:hypothetical protein HOLleu_29248 [Holothuria leucospilota]